MSSESIQGASGGHVQVYDSSSSGVPYVWVKVNSGRADPVSVRLSVEGAWRLSQQIQALVENHPRGPGALPEVVRREIAHKYRGEVADE